MTIILSLIFLPHLIPTIGFRHITLMFSWGLLNISSHGVIFRYKSPIDYFSEVLRVYLQSGSMIILPLYIALYFTAIYITASTCMIAIHLQSRHSSRYEAVIRKIIINLVSILVLMPLGGIIAGIIGKRLTLRVYILLLPPFNLSLDGAIYGASLLPHPNYLRKIVTSIFSEKGIQFP